MLRYLKWKWRINMFSGGLSNQVYVDIHSKHVIWAYSICSKRNTANRI